MNNNKSGNNRTVSTEPASNELDDSLFDIISSVIDNSGDNDDGNYESNMVVAVDDVLPEGVKRTTRPSKCFIQNPMKNKTRSADNSNTGSNSSKQDRNAGVLVTYVNENDKNDKIYNIGHAFDTKLIHEAITEIETSHNEKIHPTVFVRVTTKIHYSDMINRIHNVHARRRLPNILGRIFFNPRALNDLRMKTKNIKDYMDSSAKTDSGLELQIYGLLSHLNNIMYGVA